jgi:hypothetical protein
MESNFFEKIPMIAPLYLKSVLREYKTYSELVEELKFYSDKHSFNYEYTLYIFLLNCLKNDDFFKLNEGLRENLLYDSSFWASLNETRRKTRPTSYEDIAEDKKDAFFTKLQKEVIKGIYRAYDPNHPMFDIILSKYLLLFFDLSCIKRDRRGKCSKN